MEQKEKGSKDGTLWHTWYNVFLGWFDAVDQYRLFPP